MPRDESDERAERDLVELYKQREQVAAALKVATGMQIAVGQALLQKIDADIERFESAIAPVQEAAAKHDAALDARRRQILTLLPRLDAMEKEPTFPKAALAKLKQTRAEALRFLREDAKERGIPNDDH